VVARAGVTSKGQVTIPAAVRRQLADQDVPFVDAFLTELARAGGEAVCSFDRDFDRLDVERVSPSAML